MYLDEVIDVKFLGEPPAFALMCSNNPHLKLVKLDSGTTEIYKGHSHTILGLDVIKQETGYLCLTCGKDNEIRMWSADLTARFG